MVSGVIKMVQAIHKELLRRFIQERMAWTGLPGAVELLAGGGQAVRRAPGCPPSGAASANAHAIIEAGPRN